MKTVTPELDPAVLDRLGAYAARFATTSRRRSPPGGPASTSTACSTTASARASSRWPAASPSRPASSPRTPTRPCSSSSTRAPGTSRPSWRRYRGLMAETFAARRGSSSSTTPPSPSRASTPSVSSGSTAGPWARRPTARSPSSVHYVSPAGPLPAGHAALPARVLAGRPGAAGQGRRARRTYRRAADQGPDRPGVARPGPRPRGCPAGWSWPTPATASPGRSATAWPRAACTTSSA